MKNKNIAAAGSEPAACSATETTSELHTTQPYRRGKKAGKRACWKYTAASAGKTQRLAYYSKSFTLLSLTGEERKQVRELVESTLQQVQVKRGG